MAEDFTDAKREDAADLLGVVGTHSKAARQILRPGLPELFFLFAGWSVGRLPSIQRETSFVKTSVVMGAVALVIDTAVWVNRRRSLGAEVDNRAWFFAGGLAAWSAVVGLGLHGDARQLALALAFVFAALVLAILDRSGELLVVGFAMFALTIFHLRPLVVVAPMSFGSMGLGWALMERTMKGAQS